MEERYIVGVDIGGTWIRVGICTADLKEENIKRKLTKTGKENQYSISTSVNKLLNELLVENRIKKEQLIGIGLASAGPLDIEKGKIFNNANLGFKIIPLKKPIEKKFPGIPIYFINDCNGAVLGVHYFEAEDREKDNLVYITISTGIGGGVICNGHLLLGKEGNAVEVGHGLVAPKSKIQCNCGAYGCWEVFSSGTGVKNRALEAISEGKLNTDILLKIVNNDITKITAKEIFQAARKGDKLSKKVVDDCVFYTTVGFGLVNNFYDCQTIYVGGAMMKDHKQILPPIIKKFKENPIIFTINNPPEIKLTKLGDDVGLRGALALVKYKTENHKVIS
ncbi:MAG: ROK family protein [Candidatus Lokiarchaeota archaeon]|nr:ROK family protein [Candidatus Lokiarchaeota archaeon]